MSKVGAIRPCPFCGSANVKVEVDPLIAGRVSVFCKSCKAHGPIVRSERYAVTSWNDGVRRVVMDGGERLADGLEADRAAACDTHKACSQAVYADVMRRIDRLREADHD